MSTAEWSSEQPSLILNISPLPEELNRIELPVRTSRCILWSCSHPESASNMCAATHTPVQAKSSSSTSTVTHHQSMPPWSYTLWSLGIRRAEVSCTNGLYASCARSEPNARSRNSSHARRTFQRAFLNVLNLATRRGVARQSCHRHAARKADQSSKIAGADSADTGPITLTGLRSRHGAAH